MQHTAFIASLPVDIVFVYNFLKLPLDAAGHKLVGLLSYILKEKIIAQYRSGIELRIQKL